MPLKRMARVSCCLKSTLEEARREEVQQGGSLPGLLGGKKRTGEWGRLVRLTEERQGEGDAGECVRARTGVPVHPIASDQGQESGLSQGLIPWGSREQDG